MRTIGKCAFSLLVFAGSAAGQQTPGSTEIRERTPQPPQAAERIVVTPHPRVSVPRVNKIANPNAEISCTPPFKDAEPVD